MIETFKQKFREIELQRKINTLENEIGTLKNIIKEELYHEFMDYLDIRVDNERLKEQNKKLREKLKKEQAKEYKKGGK